MTARFRSAFYGPSGFVAAKQPARLTTPAHCVRPGERPQTATSGKRSGRSNAQPQKALQTSAA